MSRASSQRALAAGLIMAVTLNAFEAVAVVTAMPAISEELDGDRLYGAAFSAYMLASLVALDDRLNVVRTWIGGSEEDQAEVR